MGGRVPGGEPKKSAPGWVGDYQVPAQDQEPTACRETLQPATDWAEHALAAAERLEDNDDGGTTTLWKFPNPAGASRISLIDRTPCRRKGVPTALVNKRNRPTNTADSRCIKSRQVP